MADMSLFERPYAGKRVQPTVGECCGHHRQVSAGHAGRALAKVKLEGPVDIFVHHSEAAHQVGDGPVAMTRCPLRFEDPLVQGDRMPGEPAEPVEYAGQLLIPVGAPDQP